MTGTIDIVVSEQEGFDPGYLIGKQLSSKGVGLPSQPRKKSTLRRDMNCDLWSMYVVHVRTARHIVDRLR